MSGIELPFLVQPVCSEDDKSVVDAVRASDSYSIVIAGRTIQPFEILLPTEVITLDVSTVLIEQQSSNVPNHLPFPRTPSKVTKGECAIIQVLNTSPTDTTLYKNIPC